MPTPVSSQLQGEPGALPTYEISSSTPCSANSLGDVHSCIVIDKNTAYTGQEGVECTDIEVAIGNSGENDVWADGTYYCQAPTLFTCTYINVQDELAYKFWPGGTTQTSQPGGYICGGNTSNGCPNTGTFKAHVSSGHLVVYGHFCIETWAVDLADNWIDTASYGDVGPYGANFASRHVNLCMG